MPVRSRSRRITPILDCIRANLRVRRDVASGLRTGGAEVPRHINRSTAPRKRPIIQWGLEHLPPFDDHELDEPDVLLSAAAEIYRMRRARDQLMPAGLVGEPAWDMLLALYSEAPGGVTVSSICRGSGVPPDAALRWVGVLEARGLINRNAHDRDQRIALVVLTEHGRAIVERCLKAMLRSSPE
jgi:DNA-binding MarR family transcriptional regulator